MVDRDALVAQGRRFLPVLAIIAVQQLVFPVSAGILVSGFVSGCVAALMAAGLSLVWRANRVVNFAQGDLGVAPATLGVLLVSLSGVS